MPRKIYDIKPPKIIRKIEKEVKDVFVKEKPRKRARAGKKQKLPTWIKISSLVCLVLVVACTYLFFKLPKAQIDVWPKVDVLSFKQAIVADKTAEVADIEDFVIPAKYFEASKTNSQEFLATGNADDAGKASGKIIIYNKYIPAMPFTFKAGTHFLSDSGNLFVCLQKISIPAATKSGTKVTPGTVTVQVQAVEGGDAYNIAPSNFSIPGLKGTAYYYSVNAVSENAMEGGYSGKIKKVTEDDILEAKNVLTEKTKTDAISDLKALISSDYIVAESAVFADVKDASTKTKAGTVAEKFEYSVTVKASTLAFKKSDLAEFAKKFIVSKMNEGKTLLENSIQINYSATVVDVTKGTAKISLDFSGGIYQDINKNSLALSLLGQNPDQIRETIKNTFGDSITKTEINFWPFWVKAAPNSQKAIEIVLKF